MCEPTPPVPNVMASNGKVMGARQPPTCLAKFCCSCHAISGYEHGDPFDGSMEGSAMTACLLSFFCGCIGGIYAAFCWQPKPENIKGDGTQRTLKNRCCAVMCVGGPCAIGFWQSGDLCTGCCEGDAGLACILDVVGNFVGIGNLGEYYACCCWKPNLGAFKRDEAMHGQRDAKPGENTQGGGGYVAQAVAVATPVNNP